MLKFDLSWRFQPPPDGRYKNSAIPPEAIWEFDSLIRKVTTQGDRWDMLEHFKGAFSRAVGQSHFRSSSESWAESDLSSVMSQAAENAPLFLEAFYEACEELRQRGLFAPDVPMINDVCQKHGIGYDLKPPALLLRDSASAIKSEPVKVIERPPTIAEQALEMLQQSLERSERLLTEGHPREAVQESLWVLESLATAFRGIEIDGEAVRGKYFNDIARDLKRVAKGSTLERVIEWVTGLHGFLSSPTGGGVRHGVDLSEGVLIGPSEARLFCNLIRSYIGYLLAEHERLKL
jgi:hypothetical protein